MSLDELKKRCGREWRAIEQAQKAGAGKLGELRKFLNENERGGAKFDSEDISIVVFGSLARGEWTSGSDLDWTFLIDGGADHEHANTARRFEELLREKNFVPPGPTGIFGNLAFSHNIIHQIGGADDSNRNTTQRMLLLLESQPVGRPEAYDRVILGILRRYLQNDFRPFRLKVPRFLLNDLHRFWRTMCVDYASKFRERAGKGWAIRNIKLRMSRKLIFTAGLVTCYCCDPRLVREREPELEKAPTVEGLANYLFQFVKRSPLDILIEALARWGMPETTQLVLDSYDSFLANLDDQDIRKHLGDLRPEQAEKDSRFQESQILSRSFEKGLECLFFDGNGHLATLNREYGVF